jgi:hypothetical protein
VLFPFVLFGDFRSPLLMVFLERFRDLSLGNLASKGALFWGFRCSRVRGVLGGISSIPLDLASFSGQ